MNLFVQKKNYLKINNSQNRLNMEHKQNPNLISSIDLYKSNFLNNLLDISSTKQSDFSNTLKIFNKLVQHLTSTTQ